MINTMSGIDAVSRMVLVYPEQQWYQVEEDNGDTLIVSDESGAEKTISKKQIDDEAYV